MSVTAGWLVLSEDGRAMWAEDRKTFPEARGVLHKSLHATIFATRSGAETAIRRSHVYSTDHGLAWPTERYVVVRCYHALKVVG